MRGQVVKLDRGFPLVKLEDGREVRCKHATALVKGETYRAVIGDIVEVSLPEGHDKAIIESCDPRRSEFVRKDPTERALPQTLAANFDMVMVAQPIEDVNLRRLERELVLAHETGVRTVVVLTKADLLAESEAAAAIDDVARIVGDDTVIAVSQEDPESIETLRALIPAGTVAILIGRSGVGKSSLVNMLVGRAIQETTPVREVDGKGRHTTVSREMIDIPGAGCVVDMPGVRGLGLWDAEEGIGAAFEDVESLARTCRFRDCTHGNEPGCAVRAAVEAGDVSPERVESYLRLRGEADDIKRKREEADRIRTRRGHPRRRGK